MPRIHSPDAAHLGHKYLPEEELQQRVSQVLFWGDIVFFIDSILFVLCWWRDKQDSDLGLLESVQLSGSHTTCNSAHSCSFCSALICFSSGTRSHASVIICAHDPLIAIRCFGAAHSLGAWWCCGSCQWIRRSPSQCAPSA